MGYGLATAIGAALARPGKRVILVEGDGGFAQNLQELATARRQNLPLKIFILDNHGYGSIRSTQRKFFDGAYVGCDAETGLGFPNWPALFSAFGIPARCLLPEEITRASLAKLLDGPEPAAWIVPSIRSSPTGPACPRGYCRTAGWNPIPSINCSRPSCLSSTKSYPATCRMKKFEPMTRSGGMVICRRGTRGLPIGRGPLHDWNYCLSGTAVVTIPLLSSYQA